MSITSLKIKVSGLVQGIGFRPFLAELAENLQLSGQVRNLGGVVEIRISGQTEAVQGFLSHLNTLEDTGELPGCHITSIETEELRLPMEGKFQIVESNVGKEQIRFLPVDLPTCDRCIGEMRDPNNRRYRYPFISCTSCGPRFSIQKRVPYDRDTITMDVFSMCESCEQEYTQKGNIRRHAQTIACPDCGPTLSYVYYDRQTDAYERVNGNERCLSLAVEALRQGKIGAVKDIGGYHFAVLVSSREAICRLRVFKNRDKKPFAVMFADLEQVREYCHVTEAEEKLLCSDARPIVLLQKKKDFLPEICGESDRIGALLPCNPLQILLLEELGPLIMTSGNRGGEPIITAEDAMLLHLQEGIDFMLTHDREILTPLDDSIYQVTQWDEEYHPQLIRRARGLVPNPIALSRALSSDTYAAGGDLKAVFALGRKQMVYLSQYFGDLDDLRCQNSRKEGKKRMQELLELSPERFVCDLHPGYHSGKEALRETKGNVTQVQHHHAHIASVLAEHGLEDRILGVACDGTGFGCDGTIWGSEFLLCEKNQMQRVGHFASVRLLGGDLSAKQADLTLNCCRLEAEERGMDLGTFTGDPLQKAAWKNQINTAVSSSMGRLFDAAAAFLDICHENSYEGLCAIKLEQAAHIGRQEFASYEKRAEELLKAECSKQDGIWQADSVRLLADLKRVKEQYSAEISAYLFHHAVAGAILEISEKIIQEQPGISGVALSGGTFINRILLQEVMQGFHQKGIPVWINEQVPCGDGGIALGQMWLETFENEYRNEG